MIEITLSNGATTVVGNEDAWAATLKWTYSHGYAQHRVGGKIEYLHRAIAARMGIPPDVHVDHRNLNKLDNLRSNLRSADKSRNGANRGPMPKRATISSQYKGAYWATDKRRWKSCIAHQGRQIHLGYFDTAEQAAAAYNDAALRLFGEYARLNEIEAA